MSVRVFLAFVIAGLALGGALWLHRWESVNVPNRVIKSRYSSAITPAHHRKASWQDPAALFIAVAGVGAGIAVARRTPPPIS